MTEKELMQDEAIVKIAVAMKKISIEYNVPVSEMISEGHNIFDWIRKLPTVSTPCIQKSLEEAKSKTQNGHECKCLDDLSKVLGDNPCIANDGTKCFSALWLSFMLASIGTLTVD